MPRRGTKEICDYKVHTLPISISSVVAAACQHTVDLSTRVTRPLSSAY